MILLEKTNVDGEFVYERYDLDSLCRADQTIPAGLLTAYLLGSSQMLKLDYFLADFQGDPGYIRPEERTEGGQFKKRFPDPRTLARTYGSEEFNMWDMSFVYKGVKVYASGDAGSSETALTYDPKDSVNLIPLLAEIEDRSWKFHGMDPALLGRMRKAFSLSETGAVRALLKLQEYPDIWEEFMSGMEEEPFCFPISPVRVEGYSARDLKEGYPLSILGAYNYLIYLRHSPEQALQDLKDGLKRK